MFPFKNFAISTGKLPCWSLSSIKLLDLQRLIYINYLFVNKRTKIKKFIKKLHKFTNDNFSLAISYKTRKIKSLFKIKDKNLYPACKTYYGECEKCGDNYIGKK